MKKLYVLAVLLMASTAAHAGNSISFEIEGHKIRIAAPKNCDSLSCIQISAPSLSGSGFGFKSLKSGSVDDSDDDAPRAEAPMQTSASAPAEQAAAPQPSVAPASSAPSAPTAIASTAPAASDDAPSAPSAASPAAPKQDNVAATPVQAPTTPLGVWATENNKGNVRVEECGQNLCGYAVKTGEKILINMRPSNSKWTGKIHDPSSGRNYSSTIVMKGPNSLKVQGCALGGMFCGGQTWKRVS